MTVNEKIIQALEPFAPVLPDYSDDDKAEYFTFNYADDRAEEFGDDEPLAVVDSMQIHYFCPMDIDYLELKKRVRKALFAAGFTYPSVNDVSIQDGLIRHLVFECEIINTYELDEES